MSLDKALDSNSVNFISKIMSI